MLPDLREFIDVASETGELEAINGADWDLEIGAITEIVAQQKGGPAVLFDEIDGYPAGFRVLTNPFGSIERTKWAMNIDSDLGPLEAIDA